MNGRNTPSQEKDWYMRLVIAIAAWLLLCSTVSFVQYASDKRRARLSRHRIPERVLLLTALAGGWPGGMVASRVFRHKTRKMPYRGYFALTVAGNLVFLAFVLWVLWPWENA